MGVIENILNKNNQPKGNSVIENALNLQKSNQSAFSKAYDPMVAQRVKSLQTISDANTSGQQGFLESAYQTGGELLGSASDPFAAALQAYSPNIIKKPLNAIGNFIGKGVQDVANKISDIPAVQQYAQTPESKNLERDIKAFNQYLVLLAPNAKGSSGLLGKLSSKFGDIAEESGKKTLSTLRGKFIRDLTRPEQTNKIKLMEVPRTTEIGRGPFKKSIIEPSFKEAKIAKEVLNIPNVGRHNTFQRNYNVISAFNKQEAKKLVTLINKNDFIYPRQELISRLNETRSVLSENPLLVGDAGKTASKMVDKVEQMVNEVPAKGSNLLEIRKNYDNWIQSQKGQNIFDPKNENALSIANREIRRTINDFLDEKATKVSLKDSLRKQSNLYGALENIAPKAAKEADSAIGRLFQKSLKIMRLKNLTVEQMGTLIGVAGFGSAALFAPAVAAVGIPSFLTIMAGKLILKPELRITIGKLFKMVGKSLNNSDRKVIKNLLSTGVETSLLQNK